MAVIVSIGALGFVQRKYVRHYPKSNDLSRSGSPHHDPFESVLDVESFVNIKNANIEIVTNKKLNANLRPTNSDTIPIKNGVRTLNIVLNDPKYEFSVFRSASPELLEMIISEDGYVRP
jgi:hypothetical protein